MQRVKRVVPIVVALLGVSACGSPKPIKYYAVQVPAAPSPTSYKYPIHLQVGRITGPDLLEAEPIVYKTGKNEIGTYAYHRWTEAPVQLAQTRLMRLLRASGECQSVSTAATGAGELVIRGNMYEFTEVDGDSIVGLVTMEFELWNRRTGNVLWTHFYSQTEPVASKEVPAVVQALDHNLDRGLKEVVTALGQYFAANPPGKPVAVASGT